MYAIVDIAGQQFKVEKDQEIFVNRLEGDKGSKVEFFDVLLIDNNGKITVGTPKINGAMISCKIIEHLKGDKVLVFRKKRRKGFKRLRGHRDYLSKVVIESIVETGAKPKVAAKKEEKPKVEAKPKAATAKAKTTEAPKAKAEVKKAPVKT
ncbi:50S ribosomal protein L21 [Bacteroidota bacterium]